MEELILVRHGQSEYNIKLTNELDSQLTAVGIQQAHETGRYIKANFDLSEFIAITSPYKRCLQTARILREETGLDFSVHLGPREIMIHYDLAEIKNHREIFPEFNWEHEHDLILNRETEADFLVRMKEFHQEIKHPKLLVVSHGSPVNTIYEYASGLDAGVDCVTFVKNCSISYVKDGKGVFLGKVVYEE